MSQSTQSGSPATFFDLHVEGVAYLNRVRLVRPKKGQGFLACGVSALRGPAGEVDYTKFDCRVSGAEAKKIAHSPAGGLRRE